MIRNLILLFNMAAFLIYRIIFQDGGVEIKQNVPQTVKAGSEFTVELTINKGATSGFAKFQQELPAGMTATVVDAKSGTFSFVDQNVKIIWMSLPGDKEFKVTYKVSVSKDLSGPTPLVGKFSFIDNNEKKTVSTETSTVDIENPDKAAAATTTPVTPAATDTSRSASAAPGPDTQTSTTAVTATGTSGVSCTRNISPITSPDEYTVEVKINRGSVSGFAKLEETVPAGFTASVVEPQNSVFSFVDQKAKFLWMALPSENEIVVSYKVKREGSTATDVTVDGLFSYLENDVTQKVVVPAQNLTLVPGAVASTQRQAQPDTQTTTTPTNTAAAETTATAQKEPVKQPVTEEPKTVTENVPSTAKTETQSQPAAQTGKVNYKVQIMAAHKTLGSDYFQTNHQISDQVASEMHEGWHKFLIGSYSEYKQARDKRESVSQNKLPGPFVTAYNGGKRITVQEALMISSQKWVK